MKFKLKDVEGNPFRSMARYPIRPDKVVALRESIRTTIFWDNIVARQVGNKAQIACGHHRLEALRAEYPEDREIALIIRDVDDETMLRA